MCRIAHYVLGREAEIRSGSKADVKQSSSRRNQPRMSELQSVDQ